MPEGDTIHRSAAALRTARVLELAEELVERMARVHLRHGVRTGLGGAHDADRTRDLSLTKGVLYH